MSGNNGERAPSDEEMLETVAEAQRDHKFAGLKYQADQHGGTASSRSSSTAAC
ncbi:MAG: hypothetical protein L0221_04885 [Chloroflexi bacterium]|nr:hypothetical protein [Chloroflexota bacterium]